MAAGRQKPYFTRQIKERNKTKPISLLRNKYILHTETVLYQTDNGENFF